MHVRDVVVAALVAAGAMLVAHVGAVPPTFALATEGRGLGRLVRLDGANPAEQLDLLGVLPPRVRVRSTLRVEQVHYELRRALVLVVVSLRNPLPPGRLGRGDEVSVERRVATPELLLDLEHRVSVEAPDDSTICTPLLLILLTRGAPVDDEGGLVPPSFDRDARPDRHPILDDLLALSVEGLAQRLRRLGVELDAACRAVRSPLHGGVRDDGVHLARHGDAGSEPRQHGGFVHLVALAELRIEVDEKEK